MHYASWDTKRARLLFDDGVSLTEIAKRMRVSRATIRQYADRHWPRNDAMQAYVKRDPNAPPRPVKPRKIKPGQSTLPPLASLGE